MTFLARYLTQMAYVVKDKLLGSKIPIKLSFKMPGNFWTHEPRLYLILVPPNSC